MANTVASQTKTRIRGLLVGINSFPKLAADHQLHGCVRDTENVCKLLVDEYKVAADDIRQLHNERATRKAVLDRLAELVSKTRENEIAVFHISTHGALITRREPSGAVMDHASEILCMSNISPNLDDPDSYISDSDLAASLSKLHPGALFVAIMDACHAGATDIARTPSNRFLPPPADIKHRDAARIAKFGTDQKHRLFERASRNAPGHVLVLTACTANQTSDDTVFGHDHQGAFTHFLCAALTKNSNQTYATLLDAIQAGLKKNKDKQTPEFMPAIYSGSSVFRPLIEPKFSAACSGKPAQLAVLVGGKEVKTKNVREGITGKFAEDKKHTKLLKQLAQHGFDVHTLPGKRPDEFAVDVEHGYAALHLEFSEGMAIWTKPAGKVAARARGGQNNAPSTDTRHHFKIAPLPKGTQARSLGGVIDSIFHVVTHPIEALTQTAVSLIEDAVFDEGLYHIQGNSFSSGVLKNPPSIIAPPDPNNPRAVLFIHGVLSSIDGCYNKSPLTDPSTGILRALQSRYIVLGYNHRSASISISDIAQQLNNRLQQCISGDTQLYVVAHSQGGVIARQLGQLCDIKKIITFGSPHQGTNLANHLDKFVTILNSLSFLFPSAMSVLFQILKYIDDPEVIPGFLDMKVGSDRIKALNEATGISTDFYCGTSDFKPGPDVNELTRVAEEADSTLLFDNAANDLVIDTANMVPPTGFNIVDQLDFVSPPDQVIHTEYFDQPLSSTFITSALA